MLKSHAWSARWFYPLGLHLVVMFVLFGEAALAIGVEDFGVSATEIRIGTVNVTSGPASSLGNELNAGAKAYFEQVNKQGGVHGRKIKWLTEDDGYEPERTIEKVRLLVEEKKVFALFNGVGTPTSQAILPFLATRNIPVVGIFSGAQVLRQPVQPNVFNIRASYFEETELMIKNLVDNRGIKKIGLLIQDDGFGKAGQGGVHQALAKRGMNPKKTVTGLFARNTENIDEALSTLAEAKPDAVIMVGTYKPQALFVKKAHEMKFRPIFMTLSFVGTSSFVKAVGNDCSNCYITQVVPNPETSSLKVVRDYRDAMAAVNEPLSYGSLEGYLNAVTLVEGLKKAGKGLTRAGLRNALEDMKADLGGFQIAFSQKKHQGSEAVYLTKISGGKAVEVKSID